MWQYMSFINWRFEMVFIYRIVASRSTSRLVTCLDLFRLLMKGIFGPYVLWPLDKKLIFWIVTRVSARDYTVYVSITLGLSLLQFFPNRIRHGIRHLITQFPNYLQARCIIQPAQALQIPMVPAPIKKYIELKFEMILCYESLHQLFWPCTVSNYPIP